MIEDTISELCLKKYNEFSKNGKPRSNEWTLLSGFIIKLPNDDLKLVSLATGTKCIGKSKISLNGSVLSDCHSEVLARRGLLRYIYENIELTLDGHSSLLLESVDNKLRLKSGVEFYMYSSHVPCGDASIIPMIKRKSNDDCNEQCNKKIKINFDDDQDVGSLISRDDNLNSYDDIHRTGGKSISGEETHGPGKFYHTVGLVRNKPGRGEPTLSLSCSDKIAKWIYCGIQGALLSLLIEEKINLKLIVIGGGGQFCMKAMKRALMERCCCPSQYHPEIKQSKVVFQHSRYKAPSDSKPCSTSIVWSLVKNKPFEVCVEGKKLGATKNSSDVSSRLKVSRMELFLQFIKLSGDKYKNMNYKQIKSKASHYYDRFQKFKTSIGCWTNKPLSSLEFLPDLPT